MAGNKSCEGKLTTLECMECGYREVFTERQFKFVDGYLCDVCNGPVTPTITKPGEKLRNRKLKKQGVDISDNKHTGGIDFASSYDWTAKVNIDVSDALKGLKAVQREAKKTARLLREVEDVRSFNPVLNITVNSNDDPKKIAEAVKVQIEKISNEWT